MTGSASGEGKAVHPSAGGTQSRAARASLGSGVERLCFRRTGRNTKPLRAVRRPKPADRLSFHVRTRLGRRMPALFLLGDSFNGVIVHLNQRDVTMVAVSHAPYSTLAAYRKRMGWSFNGFPLTALISTSTTKPHSHRHNANPRRRFTISSCKTRALPSTQASASFTGRHRPPVPHLFHVCPRHRHREHGLQLPRHGSQGTSRGAVSNWVRRHDEYAASLPTDAAGQTC
jgi:Bacterial protein of unknown function (DUF899)